MGQRPSFPVVSQQGRVALVTGGNTGLGYETAKHLAMMGASVVIACRSEQRARDAIARMKEEAAKFKASGKKYDLTLPDDLDVEFMPLDLSSLKSTMKFVNDYKESGRPLHILMCNAGIALIPREITEDGFEKMFQVNYLGHFLIVAHLLDVMKKSGEDCRIVFTSSAGHRLTGGFDLDTVQGGDPAHYSRLKFYGKSKIYQIMHMHSLARRLQDSNVSVTSVHPGVVDTEIPRGYQDATALTGLVNVARGLGTLKTPLQGATTMIDAAVNPKHRGVSGVYFIDCKPASTTAEARSEDHQEALWRCSVDCLKDFLQGVDIAQGT